MSPICFPFRPVTPTCPGWDGYQQVREQFVSGGIVQPDPAQEVAMIALGRLGAALMARADGGGRGGASRGARGAGASTPEAGLFLWGGVGRGKTRLLDALARALPLGWVLRWHQHDFLDHLHRAIFRQQGATEVQEPFPRAVQSLLGGARLLILDELHAYDVADAEILGRACQEVWAQGCSLCFTANHLPAALWPETGRHRHQRHHMDALVSFIGAHCTCLQVDGGRDYRERRSPSGTVSPPRWWPADDPGAAQVKDWVAGVEVGAGRLHTFAQLCGQAHSHQDLTHLLVGAHRLGILELPAFTPAQGDPLRRFIWLLDIAWEQGLPLAVSAASSRETLFHGIGQALLELLGKDLARAVSRLGALVSGEISSPGYERD